MMNQPSSFGQSWWKQWRYKLSILTNVSMRKEIVFLWNRGQGPQSAICACNALTIGGHFPGRLNLSREILSYVKKNSERGRDEFPRIKVFKVWKYGGGRGALQKHWSVRDRFWSRIHQRPISTPPYYTSPPPPPPPCKSVVWGFGGGVLQKPPICSSSTPGLQTYFHLGNYQIRQQETHQMCQIGKVTKDWHSLIISI